MNTIKKIVIYGDSISTAEYGNGGYEAYLREGFGAEVMNYSVCASGLSLGTPDNTLSILERDECLHGDADVVILWHGTNEWYWGSEIGRPGSKDGTTFLGALDRAVGRIREKSPGAVLFILTPIYRYQAPDGCENAGPAYELKNKAGYTLTDYYNALREASVYYGVPLIDMRVLSGIHEGNYKEYLEDDVHPNEQGYKKIWKVLEQEIYKAVE